ncbi:MAG: hypothetical protein EKK46_02140 [Rhodocyclaceae bacterium]|nr:MAG: hypothetical protein EKK46_02140 [Rhodocyclaceae bacterium]
MAQVINTNVTSLNAQRNLNTSQMSLQTALQRLSSGLRINSAKDDAAGLAISDRMTSQIRGLNQAVRNANDGISLAQTADSAMSNVGDILQRMRELAIQSANATNSDSDRTSIQSEVSQLKQELTRIANTTTFNGQKILNGSQQNISFQVGAEANQTIGISIGDSRSTSIGNNVVFASNAAKSSSYNRFTTDGVAVGKAQTATNTLSTMTNGYSAQTLKITDASGASIENGKIGVLANDQASDVAARLNRLQGVEATANNVATISSWTNTSGTAGNSVTFKISSGSTTQTLTLSGVDETSSQTDVFNALKSAVNSNAALQAAGVTAGLDSSSNLSIRNSTGADLGIQLTTVNAGNTVAVKGFDTNSTSVTLTGNGTNATKVGGQLNIKLANGYNIQSSVAGTTGNTGFFKVAANTNVSAAESNVGIDNVVTGQDTATNRVNSAGLIIGQAQTASANAVNNGIAAQTIKVKDAAGNVVGNSSGISVSGNATVKTIVGQLNGLDGVTATGSAQATISKFTGDGSTNAVTLSVNGTALTISGVDGTNTASEVSAAIRDAVNQNSTLKDAGFSATLNATGDVVIKNNTGDDIKFVFGGSTSTASVTGTDAASTAASITTTNVNTTVSGSFTVALKDGYTIESSVSGKTAAAGGLFDTTANAKAANAITAVNYGNSVAAQTLTITGAAGSASVNVLKDDDAATIAARVNGASSSTGVSASATTQAKLSGISAAGTVSFTLFGSNTSGVNVSAAVTGSGSLADLSTLASAINAKAASTGISATLADNNSSIVLSQADGKNITIADFTHSAGSAPTASNISGADASLQVTALSTKVDSSGNVTSSATNTTTLHFGGTTNKGEDSTTVGGTVSFSAATAFDVKSSIGGGTVDLNGGNTSLFSASAGSTNASSFSSINGVDVSSVTGANNAISVIDAALSQVNSIRSQLGAVQNRIQTTVSNLSAGAENITAARSRIQDADFAQETANLTRSQILQQAGVAMLSQANQLPQLVLSLLK